MGKPACVDNRARRAYGAAQCIRKGLEYPVVVIPDCSTPPYPRRSGGDEDRRVLYVAVTRARDRVYLCRTGQDAPTPFLL